MLTVILNFLGFQTATMTRQEAAEWLLQRDVKVTFKPVIVELRHD